MESHLHGSNLIYDQGKIRALYALSNATELYRAFVARENAAFYQARLSMARHIYSAFPEFAVNKYVLSLRGFPFRHCRPPLTDLTDDQKVRFEKLMRAAGLWDL